MHFCSPNVGLDVDWSWPVHEMGDITWSTSTHYQRFIKQKLSVSHIIVVMVFWSTTIVRISAFIRLSVTLNQLN